jgi:SET domain-containing protein
LFTAKRDIEEGEEICINYYWPPKKLYSCGIISKEEFDALKKD